MSNFLFNDICLIMALEVESQDQFESRGIYPWYCGIGKVNAAYLTMRAISLGAKAILNLGSAGSHRFPTHDLIQVKTYVQRDMDLSPLGFPRGKTPMDEISGEIEIQTIDLGYRSGICGTGDSFEVGPPQVACDLVDMEGFAMAKVCKKEKIPFYSYKFITDGSDHKAHKDWNENLKAASVKLFDCLEKFKHHHT